MALDTVLIASILVHFTLVYAVAFAIESTECCDGAVEKSEKRHIFTGSQDVESFGSHVQGLNPK
jgi:hypothetical protein